MKRFLVILLALVLLFAAVSCNNEPEKNPTIPPAPGAIPAEPNSDTEIKHIGQTEMKALSDMFEELSALFAEIFSDPKDISRDPTAGPAVSASGKITLSTASGLSAEVKADELGVFFQVETTDLSALINVLTGEGLISLRDGEDYIAIVIEEGEEGYDIYVDGADDPIDDESEEYETLMGKLLPAAAELVSGFSKSTLSIEDVEVSVGPVTVKAEGSASFDVVFNEDLFDSLDIEVASIITSGTFKIQSLKLSVEMEGGLSGKFEIEDLSLSADKFTYDDKGLVKSFEAGLSFKDIAVMASYKDARNDFSAMLELMDTEVAVTFDSTKENDVVVKGKTSVGVGLKVNENSIGVVAALSADTSVASENPADMFTAKATAVVINGAYYDPDEFVDLAMQMAASESGEEDPIL